MQFQADNESATAELFLNATDSLEEFYVHLFSKGIQDEVDFSFHRSDGAGCFDVERRVGRSHP